MREMSSVRLCIVIYGALLTFVSLSLLLSLSSINTTDNVVVMEARVADDFFRNPPVNSGETHSYDRYEYVVVSNEPSQRKMNETEVTAGISTTPSRSPVRVVVPFDNKSPLKWKSDSNEKSWPSGFCRNFIGETYQLKSEVCSRVTCRGSRDSKKTGTCTIKGVAVSASKLGKALRRINIKKMKTSYDTVMDSLSAWLVSDGGYRECLDPKFTDVENYMEPLDYVRPFVKMVSLRTNPISKCDRWIKETTFFYVGMENHIYFKFLGWYNLHRSLMSYDQLGNYTIVRLPEGNNTFLFSEFEQAIFPNVIKLDDFRDEVVCFKELVLAPWAYGAPAFRCRIEGTALKRRCLQCNGKGIENDFKSFRRRAISGCNLTDTPDLNSVSPRRKNIVVIERKQYNRRIGDQAKSFTRVWENSHELIARLKQKFPHANVIGIYAEDLTICQQMAYAHSADILVGMHGAGMVHSWWTQEGSSVVELIPKSQRGNVAFKSLATFLGRQYKEFTKVSEVKNVVKVNIDELMKLIEPLL